MNPASPMTVNLSDVNPSPLMYEWGAIYGNLPGDNADRSGKALILIL
jgi:hypothetical protein